MWSIEAEDFTRGNVNKDFSSYGTKIGVLVNAGEMPNFVEYEIDRPRAGAYQFGNPCRCRPVTTNQIVDQRRNRSRRRCEPKK